MKNRRIFLLVLCLFILFCTSATDELKSIPTVKGSSWMNKKFVTFGDSITWYNGKEYKASSKEQGLPLW